jgi:hypothetical protein
MRILFAYPQIIKMKYRYYILSYSIKKINMGICAKKNTF